MEIFESIDKNYVKYGNIRIHVIVDNDEQIWFSGQDTTEALGYAKSSRKDAIKNHVDDDEKIQLRHIDSDVKKTYPNAMYLSESGLYSLLLSSEAKFAKPFAKWVTSEVLPSIRKYGQYKINQKLKNEQTELLKKINYLLKENATLKNDLKKDAYPQGGIVYAIDYSEEDEEIYRIGMTANMNLRKKIYDTHSLHKRKVVVLREFKHPLRLETCVRSMLYEFRFKNKKDFYICPLDQIKRAFSTCLRSIRGMDTVSITNSGSKTKQVQRGGQMSLIDKQINISEKKNLALQKKINKFDKLLLDRRR